MQEAACKKGCVETNGGLRGSTGYKRKETGVSLTNYVEVWVYHSMMHVYGDQRTILSSQFSSSTLRGSRAQTQVFGLLR